MKKQQFKELFLEEQRYAPSLSTMSPATFSRLTNGYFKDISILVILDHLKQINTEDDIIPFIEKMIELNGKKEVKNEILNKESSTNYEKVNELLKL